MMWTSHMETNQRRRRGREEGRADRLFPNNIGINDDEEEKERGKQRSPQNTNGTENTQLGQMLDQMKRVTDAASAAANGSGEISKRRRTKGQTEEERKAENSLK